jgi:hypothetical protein
MVDGLEKLGGVGSRVMPGMLWRSVGTANGMTTPQSRDDASDAAVPNFDVVAETAEGIGEAGADVAPEPDDDAGPAKDAPTGSTGSTGPAGAASAYGDSTSAESDPPARGPVTDPAEAPGRGGPGDLGGDAPWGMGGDSPMGEGSDDSAAPATDPAEGRLSDR